MKGQNEFTPSQIEKIRRLLEEKQGGSRGKQKRIRTDLADLGFFVSDFDSRSGHPFGPADLDRLVSRGKIKVAERPKRGSGKKRPWWVRWLTRGRKSPT